MGFSFSGPSGVPKLEGAQSKWNMRKKEVARARSTKKRNTDPKNPLEAAMKTVTDGIVGLLPGCEAKAQARLAMQNTRNSFVQFGHAVSGMTRHFGGMTRQAGKMMTDAMDNIGAAAKGSRW